MATEQKLDNRPICPQGEFSFESWQYQQIDTEKSTGKNEPRNPTPSKRKSSAQNIGLRGFCYLIHHRDKECMTATLIPGDSDGHRTGDMGMGIVIE